MSETLVKRSAKLAYMDISTTETPNYSRMRKFTDISISKNAKEYTRQYIDEDSDTTDVTGYSEEKSYAFDQYKGNPVHEKIALITDDELVGDSAVVKVLVVDTSKAIGGGYEARLRSYAVVPDSDGDSTDAYTYKGKLKAQGTFTKGIATISSDRLTATFTEGTSL